MIVNFICSNCKTNYDHEVGEPSIDDETFDIIFESKPVCPKCGKDKVTLSELGQTQLTDWDLQGVDLDFDIDDDFDF